MRVLGRVRGRALVARAIGRLGRAMIAIVLGLLSLVLPPHDEAIVSAILRWRQTPQQAVVHSHTVGDQHCGLRLTKVAAAAFASIGSKSQAEAAVKRGSLLVNGESVEKSRIVRVGDQLCFEPPAAPELSPAQLAARARFVAHLQLQGLRAVHEDDDVAVVYKPPGIHTKSGTNAKYAALEDGLPAILTPPSTAPDPLPQPLVMHRLDVPVAGLCVVAKTRAAALDLANQFEARLISKVYHALVVGQPAEGTALVTAPVGGLAAESSVEVLRVTPHPQWGALSTLRLRPHTGRTHQLRVHAVGLGTPIVGDDLYWPAAAQARASRGDEEPLPPLRKSGGLFLQSCAVSLERPRGQGTLTVMVAEAAKYGALRERARSGAHYSAIRGADDVESSEARPSSAIGAADAK